MEGTEQRKSFPHYVVIEFDVINSDKLTNTEKILYGFINLLSENSPKGCFASTKYLCSLMKLQPRQLKNCLAHLKQLEYININIIKNKRYIKPTLHDYLEKRDKKNENIQLFDYDWLNESDDD